MSTHPNPGHSARIEVLCGGRTELSAYIDGVTFEKLVAYERLSLQQMAIPNI